MAKRMKRTSDKVVPHPRYGDAPKPSGFNATEKMIRDSHWGYKDARIFTESAIPANPDLQNFATFPRGYYVDILKLCISCKRNFLFFALEQKHWFEELGFYVDADCVRCTECRADEHEVKRRFQRYSTTIGIQDHTNESLETLLSDAVFLWERNLIQNEHTIRRLRNLGNRMLPGQLATQEINSLVQSLDQNNANA